ncbi:MAG: DUF4345 family protein [Planctomycetota bacterium]|jgi:hypothetical protein
MGAYRLLLGFAALTFAGFGAYLAVAPQALDTWLGIRAESAAARIELRAFYGGLELGLGLFFAACAMRRAWLVPGCVALAASLLGIASVRAASLIVEGGADAFVLGALGFEATLGTVAALAARSAARPPGAV